MQFKGGKGLILTFLERTKTGDYAPVDENLITPTRLDEETVSLDIVEEDLLNSVS